MMAAAADANDGSQAAWEFIARHMDHQPEFVEVVIDKIPQYELLAPKFKELYDQNHSVETIASAYGLTWKTVRESLHFAETGERPVPPKRTKRSKSGEPRASRETYQQIAPLVAQLHDQEKMPLTQVVTELKNRGIRASYPTVRRAYGFAHRDEIRVAVDGGEEMDRGTHSLIGIEKCRQIEQLLLDEKPNPKQIVDLVGCGVSTVRRAQKKLTKPGEDYLSQRQSA